MDKKIITDEVFHYSGFACEKNYGDTYDPLWGVCSLELTNEDMLALLNGKVLETSVNGEYCLLIRKEKNDETTGG